MNTFQAFNFKNFISIQQAQILSDVFEYYKPCDVDDTDRMVGPCREITGNHFFDLLLDLITPQIEDIVGESLMPTYAFARQYYQGSYLKTHIDRDSCIYTCTLTLPGDNNSPWPIHYEINGKKHTVENSVGDLLIIKGCELPHWREKLCSKEKLQLFLHYVPNKPQYKDYFYDGSNGLALDKGSIGENESKLSSMDIENIKADFFEGANEALTTFIELQKRKNKNEKRTHK